MGDARDGDRVNGHQGADTGADIAKHAEGLQMCDHGVNDIAGLQQRDIFVHAGKLHRSAAEQGDRLSVFPG